MAEFKQIIDDALDILKFDGAVQDTLAELREKWGAQVPALLDERFDAVGVQYMKLSHEKGAAALGQELSAFGWALYNLDDVPIKFSLTHTQFCYINYLIQNLAKQNP